MKKLIFGFLLSFIWMGPVFAAIGSSAVWEVRPANGSDNNGGGYTSGGTDHSQQNGAWAAYTDLVIDASTATDITSAADPFASDDIGNIINITGGTGFTTGRYEVKSIQAGNAARLDRNVGTLGSTGGTGNLGGALATVSTAATAVVAGNVVYVKNETWDEAVVVGTTSGTSTNPIVIEGYNTSRGDAPTGSNRPRNNRAGAGTIGWDQNSNNYVIKNIWVDDAGTDCFESTNSTYINCRASNGGDKGFELSIGGFSTFYIVNCEIDNNVSSGLNISSSNNSLRAFNCYIHDNGGDGLNSGGSFLINNISDTNASRGFHASGDIFWINNTSYNNTGSNGDGFRQSDTPDNNSVIFNNISASNADEGFEIVTAGNLGVVYADYNCSYNNTGTDYLNFPTGAGANNNNSNPSFTDAANGNFAIGTALKAAGYPGAFPGALSTGYTDLGAVQRQEAASGGTNANQAVSVSY